SIICPSTEPPRSDRDWDWDAEHGVRNLRAELGRPRAQAFEPQGALVEAMEWVFPGEAGAAVHLDRALAGRDRGLGCECLRSRRCRRRLLVVFGDAPRRPVGERACELDVGVGV